MFSVFYYTFISNESNKIFYASIYEEKLGRFDNKSNLYYYDKHPYFSMIFNFLKSFFNAEKLSRFANNMCLYDK